MRFPRSSGPRVVGLSMAALLLLGGPVAPIHAADPAPLSLAFSSDITGLDPAITYDMNTFATHHLLYDTLLAYDEDLRLYPSLAAAMPEVSDDGLTFTFTLRDTPFVGKGGEPIRPVTAKDVVFSLNRVLRPDLKPNPSPVGPAFFSVIKGAQDVLDGKAEVASGLEVVDDHTVRITLDHPDRTFLNTLAMQFGMILPEEIAGLDGANLLANPVGSGPYWLESYLPGQKLTFRRNPHYWREGYPKSDAAEIRLLVSDADQVLQVEAGELDLTGDPLSAGDFTAVSSDPTYADRLSLTPINSTSYLTLDNGPESPFHDVRVRQAVAHAIDRDARVALQNGRAVAATCIFPPELPGYDPECPGYTHDLDAARALMAEAGMADGFTTTLYTDTTQLSATVAQAAVADLAQIGITVDVVPQEFATLMTTATTPHAAPMMMVGWFQDYPDPSDFIDPILSCATTVAGAFNVSQFCDPSIDERAAALRREIDLDAAIPGYQAIQRDLMEQVPLVPLDYQVWSVLRSDRVPEFSVHGTYFYDLPSIEVAG